MKKNYLLTILFLSALWGSDYMFIKIGISSIHPMLFTALRFLISSLYILTLLKLKGIDLKLERQDFLIVLLAGFFDTFLPQVLVALGERTVASGITSVILSSSAIFTFLLAHFLLKDEKITLYKLFFVITGFAGVLIIFLRELVSGQNSFHFSGLILILLASISYGLGIILLKKLGDRVSVLKSCFYLAFISFLFSTPLVFVSKGFTQTHFTLPSTLSVLFAGIGLQGFSYVLFFGAVQKFGASKTSYVGYLVPLFSMLYGSIFLKESLTIYVLLGAILIISSAYFIKKSK